MLRGKSQRIQYWRLRQYEIITFWLLALFLLYGQQGKAQNSAQQRYHQAEIDFQAFKWTDAQIGFESVFFDSTQPENAAAAFRISVCNEKLGSLIQALNFAEQACNIDTTQDEYWLHYARLLEMKYEYPRAWQIRLILIQRQPRYISRYEDALQNAWNRSDLQQSLYVTQIWQEQFGRNLNLAKKRVQIFLALNDTNAAKREYEWLIDKHMGRPDLVQAYDDFLQEISPKISKTVVCPQAFTELNAGNSENAYNLIKSCAQENPENLSLLETQFLIAYFNGSPSEMENCIAGLYTYFPFLETHAQFAEAAKSFWVESKTKSNNPVFAITEIPCMLWKCIQADIWLQTDQSDLALNLLDAIQNENQGDIELPHFYIDKLRSQILTK